MADFLSSSPTDASPPPPAYEFSQQEFDQKVSAAIERSAAEPPPQEDDVFEEWNEENFLAAQTAYREEHAAQPTSGSSSSQIDNTAMTRSYTDKEREAFGNNYNPPSEQNTASSSSSSTAPLRFSRPGPKSPEPSAKQKPSWYDEAQLSGSGSSSSSSNVPTTQSAQSTTPNPTQPSRRQLPTPAAQLTQLQPGHSASGKAPVSMEQQSYQPLKVAEQSKQPQVHSIPEEEEIDNAPPPPFAPVDNSLDGPAYELVQSQSVSPHQMSTSNDPHAELNSQHGHVSPSQSLNGNQGIILRYNGADLSSSPPPSPPQSPVQSQSALYSSAQPHYQHQRPQMPEQPITQQHHRSMPPPPRQRVSPGPRPTSAFPSPSQQRQRQPAPPPLLPRMEFDPLVAYAKQSNSVFGSLPTEEPCVNPSALYNSAVVSHLAPRGARPQPVAQQRKFTQLYGNVPQTDTFSNSQSFQQYQPQFQQTQQSQTFVNQFQQMSLGAGGATAGNRMSMYPAPSVSPISQYPMNAQPQATNKYGMPMQGVPPRPVSVASSMSEQPMWGMQGQHLPAQYYQHG